MLLNGLGSKVLQSGIDLQLIEQYFSCCSFKSGKTLRLIVQITLHTYHDHGAL